MNSGVSLYPWKYALGIKYVIRGIESDDGRGNQGQKTVIPLHDDDTPPEMEDIT